MNYPFNTPGAQTNFDKRLVKKYMNIDSRFRKNYYNTSSTDYHIELPAPMQEVVELSIEHMEVIECWYSISSDLGNNFFWIKKQTNEEILKYFFEIPPGNYDCNTLNEILANLKSIESKSSAQIRLCELVIFNLRMNKLGVGSNKTLIVENHGDKESNIIVHFDLDKYGNKDNIPLPLKFGWMLGFRFGYYKIINIDTSYPCTFPIQNEKINEYLKTIEGNNTFLVSEGIIDISSPRYFYLAIDDYNNSTVTDHFASLNASLINKNILLKYCCYNKKDSTLDHAHFWTTNFINFKREYAGPVEIKKLHIKLIDEYGRVMNFNNMDFSFVLSFKTLYMR